MHIPKKYLYDKQVLFLLSVLLFLTVVTIISIALRLGSGQGISDYYIEYRQGPHHSSRGDFSPTGSVWSMMTFVWFVLITLVFSAVMSFRTYLVKREIAVVVLALGILLTLLALIVSNILLGHR